MQDRTVQDDNKWLGKVQAAAVEELDHPEETLCADNFRNPHSGAGLFAADFGPRTRESIHVQQTYHVQ